MDTIPWDIIRTGSPWILVSAFVLLVYRGNLVPRSTLEDANHEKNEWKTESRIKDQQITELHEHVRLLSEVGKTVDAIMRSIQRNARSGDRGSHQDRDDG
jgi:hypothetical protein